MRKCFEMSQHNCWPATASDSRDESFLFYSISLSLSLFIFWLSNFSPGWQTLFWERFREDGKQFLCPQFSGCSQRSLQNWRRRGGPGGQAITGSGCRLLGRDMKVMTKVQRMFASQPGFRTLDQVLRTLFNLTSSLPKKAVLSSC